MIQNFQTPTNSLIQKWVFKIAVIIKTSLEHPDLGIFDKKLVATDITQKTFS
jgi:hypothetical protein